jgi:hypothetical protein
MAGQPMRILIWVYGRDGWPVGELLAAIDTADDFSFDSIRQMVMDTWTRGRVTLVGDAGHSPIGDSSRCSGTVPGTSGSVPFGGAGRVLPHRLDDPPEILGDRSLLPRRKAVELTVEGADHRQNDARGTIGGRGGRNNPNPSAIRRIRFSRDMAELDETVDGGRDRGAGDVEPSGEFAGGQRAVPQQVLHRAEVRGVDTELAAEHAPEPVAQLEELLQEERGVMKGGSASVRLLALRGFSLLHGLDPRVSFIR